VALPALRHVTRLQHGQRIHCITIIITDCVGFAASDPNSRGNWSFLFPIIPICQGLVPKWRASQKAKLSQSVSTHLSCPPPTTPSTLLCSVLSPKPIHDGDLDEESVATSLLLAYISRQSWKYRQGLALLISYTRSLFLLLSLPAHLPPTWVAFRSCTDQQARVDGLYTSSCHLTSALTFSWSSFLCWVS
jgi:hypothetical protein